MAAWKVEFDIKFRERKWINKMRERTLLNLESNSRAGRRHYGRVKLAQIINIDNST